MLDLSLAFAAGCLLTLLSVYSKSVYSFIKGIFVHQHKCHTCRGILVISGVEVGDTSTTYNYICSKCSKKTSVIVK